MQAISLYLVFPLEDGCTFKTLLLLSQFMWSRSNSGLHKFLCKYVKIRSTHKQNGLAVSMELWRGERNLVNIEIQHTNYNSGHDCPGIHTRGTRSLNNKTITYSQHALRTIRKQVLQDQSGTRSLNNKTITYSEHTLRTIGKQVLQDQRLRLLPFGAISTIRSLRINRKPQKSARDKRTPYKQYKTDKANLINVMKIHESKHGNITIGTCNIQSVPKKELQVSDLISDYSLDLLVLTETWLTSNHDSWKNTTQFNRDNLNLHTADRPQGRGGLALITREGLTVSLHDKGTKPSFEFAHWSVKSRKTTLNIHGIYHPPYSLTNKITNQMFIDDFTMFQHHYQIIKNNIYIGNFNLHVSDQQDTDSAIFNDSTEAMGLYQHVHFQTHKSGNVLDLLLSDITQSMGVLTVAPGPYLSEPLSGNSNT